MDYMDLIYFGYEWGAESATFQREFMNDIKVKFPDVELKDGYDSIKGYRQEVYLSKQESDNYFAWMIGAGWFEMSLTMQLMMMDKEKHSEFEKAFALAKKQYPNSFKPDATLQNVQGSDSNSKSD